MSRRQRLLILYGLTALALLAAPFAGATAIGPADVWRGADETLARIFWDLRVPRVLVAAVAGGALALGGVAFQALFRNALAEPYVLGVSAGASAGIAVAVAGGGLTAALAARAGAWWPALGAALAQTPGTSAAGFAGALAAIGAVYAVSRTRVGMDASALLLAGVAMSFFFASVVMLVQYVAPPRESGRLARALIGETVTAGFGPLLRMLPFVVAGGAVVLWSRRELDLLSCGEELARTRGVDVRRVRRRLFLGVSLMTAGVTALCSPIGFVGLMAPHACRRWVGAGHAALAPAAAAAGALFLVVADAAGRTVLAPTDVPVGLVMALLGGPFFLVLLLRRDPAAL